MPEGSGESTRNLVLRVAYDGSRFFGFQFQPSFPTVQGAIQNALGQILHHPYKLLAAARTDTGVHALDQVVSVRTTSPIPPDRLARALNHKLGPYVRVRGGEERPLDFHPRYTAVLRQYRYVMCPDRSLSTPLTAAYVTFVTPMLDFDLMERAAQKLVGSHNFVSFTTCPSEEDRPCRSIESIRLGSAGAYRYLDLFAPSFLRGMVRNMVGWLLTVGSRVRPPEVIDELLARPVKDLSCRPAPAAGLYLMNIFYPGDPRPAGTTEDSPRNPVPACDIGVPLH